MIATLLWIGLITFWFVALNVLAGIAIVALDYWQYGDTLQKNSSPECSEDTTNSMIELHLVLNDMRNVEISN